LCGAKYPTLNLVYPYMEIIKKSFAPKDNDSVETFINLIYGENYEEVDDDDYDNEQMMITLLEGFIDIGSMHIGNFVKK
jgi:hypothetical protein